MKRRYRKRKASKSTKAVANKALRIAKSVKLTVERKFYDQLITGNITDNQLENLYFLNPITQGPGQSQRDGLDYVLRSVQFDMHILFNATTRYRFILVLDRDPQGLAVTWGGILATVSSSLIFNAPRQLDHTKRFKILWDKSGYVDLAMKSTAKFKKYFKLGHKCKNSGTAGTIAQVTNNSLYLIMLSDQTAVGSQPYIHLYTRVRFEG